MEDVEGFGTRAWRGSLAARMACCTFPILGGGGGGESRAAEESEWEREYDSEGVRWALGREPCLRPSEKLGFSVNGLRFLSHVLH